MANAKHIKLAMTNDKMKKVPDLYIRNIRSESLRKIWLNGTNNMVKSEMFGGPFDGRVGWLGWNFFVELVQTGQFTIEGTQLSTKGGGNNVG